jgi:DnaJ-class molecular chaperone
MDNNIIWETLQKSRTVTETIHYEKELPEGVYACPNCQGSGQSMSVHRTFGPHGYSKCGICAGTGEIIKCDNCKTNPVPNNPNWFFYPICHVCNDLKLKQHLKELTDKEKIK